MCHRIISLVSMSTCTFSEILIVFIALIVLNVLTHQIGFAKQEFFFAFGTSEVNQLFGQQICQYGNEIFGSVKVMNKLSCRLSIST